MNKFRKKLIDILEKIEILKDSNITSLIEVPKDSSNGDFSLPCFSFAKKLAKNPNELSKEILGNVIDNNYFDVSTAGPFLNFSIKKEYLINDIFNFEDNTKDLQRIGNNEKVLIEYSSPNTNKSQHIGHLRNNLLGMSLSNIFKQCGFDVVTTCLFNDKGTAIAKTIWGYIKYGNNSSPENIKSDKFVSNFYVMASQAEKEDKSITEEINEINRKWENGDSEIRSIWRKLVDWVLEGYKETYNKIGCDFDKKYYESEIYKNGKEIVLEGLESGVFVNSNGAVVTDLEKYNLPDTIVLKSDGTSLYITQDFYLAKLRNEEIHPNKVIYIVGNEQNLQFKQLFAVLEQLGIGKREQYFHLNYGYISLPNGRMKSREGTVVDADDLIDEVIKEAGSEEIGLGAIKFQFLKIDAFSDFIFDPSKSIEMTGDTSVYIQYVYARINSILEKNIDSNNIINKDLELEQEEINLMRELSSFNDSMERVVETYSPSHLCKKLLNISNSYNSFYQKCRILDLDNEDLKYFRIELSKLTAKYIKYGLNLLNINTVNKM